MEDDGIVAMDIESRLEKYGYSVCGIVSYGEKAIEKVEELKPDLVMMDIVLKGEMDGIEAAEIILSRFGMPVIFLTAHVDDERLEKAKISIPFGYIIKPFQDRTIKITIEMALYKAKVDSERRGAEEALRASEEKYRDLYENAPNAYFSVSAADGSIVKINKKATQLMGYDREVLIGMNLFELYADTPHGLVKAKEIFEHFKDGQHVNDVELQMEHMDGHTIWVSHFVKPIKDQDENLIESRFFVLDISKRKRLETQLVQAQKMESIGTSGRWHCP